MKERSLFPYLILLFFAFSNGSAVWGQNALEFLGPVAYAGGSSFSAGMVTNDHDVDMVETISNQVRLRTGNGDGTFSSTAEVIFQCTGDLFSSNIARPMIGDFTGDGISDVVIFATNNWCVGSGTRTLVVLPGLASGGFGQRVLTSISNSVFTPSQNLTSDLNGDGRLDVILASSFSVSGGDKIAVFLSAGNGNFETPVVYDLSSQAHASLTIADFTGDGRPDFAIKRRSPGDIALMANIGNGTFGPVQSVASFFVFNGVIAAVDANQDGKNDIAVIRDQPSNGIQIWFGNGAGAFSEGPIRPISISVADTVSKITVGDFSTDGIDDLLLSYNGRSTILNGTGNGEYVEVPGAIPVGSGWSAAADFNNDGRLDFATTQTLTSGGSPNGTSQEYAVLLNTPAGRLNAAPSIELPFGGADAAADDLNGDGLLDFVVAGQGGAEVLMIYQSPSAKSFGRVAERDAFSTQLLGEAFPPRAVATGDFDQDGKVDIVVAGASPSAAGSINAFIIKNNGQGDFTLLTTFGFGGTINKVLVKDLNADGRPDLIFSQARNNSNPPTVYGLVISMANPNGTFDAPIGFLPNINGSSIAIADLDHVNGPDIAAAAGNTITIFKNDGAGTFTADATLPVGVGSSDLEAGDVNGDGNVDLVSLNSDSFGSAARLSLMKGSGNGLFGSALHFALNNRPMPQRLVVSDLNADGRADVAAANSGVVSLFQGDAETGLSNQNFVATTGGLTSILAADINQDNKTDLVTTSLVATFESLSILFNVTPPNVATSPAPFDYDGDGKSDVSVWRPSNGTWYVGRSGLGDMYVQPWGLNGDTVVPADYDGDGKTDLAVRRPSDNNFYVFNSSNSSVEVRNFGIAGDIPIPSDYNGDGKADVAVWRPSNGTWYLSLSGSGIFYVMPWGLNSDKPAPADFDGDGKTELVVFRPSDGKWYMFNTVTGTISITEWGLNGDRPVPGDYNGDGRADFAVYRPSNNTWYRQNSNDGGVSSTVWGLPNDFPVPGDYDGDGKIDIAVWRPSDATWYINRSTSGFFTQTFGVNGDTPTPSSFVF